MPISVAIERDMVFVLNAGGAANITGFYLTCQGTLVPMPGSTRVLPGRASAQVAFALGGDALVITEKMSNTLTVYTLDDEEISGPFTRTSAGQTPFGFEVTRMDTLVVSEAAGGAPGASTVSSYDVDESGQLRVITSALRTGETAACWVAITKNGKYAYIANTGSSTISSIAVRRDGVLTLLKAVAGRSTATAVFFMRSQEPRLVHFESRLTEA
jgi:6-phosphogluconolactonase (cycloisomerase 2 family)